MIKSMENKVVVITGGNQGLGYESARQLGKSNFYVIIGVRDLHKGEEAVTNLKKLGIEVEYLKLDVGVQESINEFTQQIAAKFPELKTDELLAFALKMKDRQVQDQKQWLIWRDLATRQPVVVQLLMVNLYLRWVEDVL